MTQLWLAGRAGAAPLVTVLAEAAPGLGGEAAGFLSSPTEHRAVRLLGSVLRTPAGPASLDGVFAARLFTADAELRWVQTADGSGDAVLVGERRGGPSGWVDEQVEVCDTIDGTYALWGRTFARSDAPGWCRAFEGRIGGLDLPVAGRAPAPTPADQDWPAEYLSLTYREYVGLDEHGNASVVEERLTGICTKTPTTGSKTGGHD
jgi:CRISPR-associated protein (TIGR03984 family)